MNSGSIITGRPSMGSWVLYGLGAEADNLPGFVVLVSQGNGGQMQPIAARQWSAGILPSKFQGVRFNSVGDPVLYITNPPGISRDMQKDSIQAINALNRGRESIAARSGTANAHRPVRDGVQDADERPGTDRHERGAAAHPGAVRREAGRRIVRVELPAGAAAGGARRAVHSALSPRLGSSRRREEQRGLQGAGGRQSRRRR